MPQDSQDQTTNADLQVAGDPSTAPAGLAEISEDQLVYADWLDWGVRIGAVGLLITGGLYLFGVVDPSFPLEQMPAVWGLPLEEYLARTGEPSGPWAWVPRLSDGEILPFLPIAALGLVTVVCYLRILPILARQKQWPFVTIAVVEVLVLLAAITGLVGGGH